jgi:hypothetical protein
MLFQPRVTPPVYWALLGVGLAWGTRHSPGLTLWVILVFIGDTIVSLSVFNNPPYNVRSQLLPTSFVVLIAAGAAPVWMELWERRRRELPGTGTSTNNRARTRTRTRSRATPAISSGWVLALGTIGLVAFGTAVLLTRHGFVTQLRDQQLEWAFLERTMPRLPEQATLLLSVEGCALRMVV